MALHDIAETLQDYLQNTARIKEKYVPLFLCCIQLLIPHWQRTTVCSRRINFTALFWGEYSGGTKASADYGLVLPFDPRQISLKIFPFQRPATPRQASEIFGPPGQLPPR